MNIIKDLRYAGRMITKSPLFTAVVVLTLAIAIGLNTTVFAAVQSMLMRPMPGASSPDRLVQLYRTSPGIPWGSTSIPHYLDVRERTTDVFSGVSAWTFASFSLSAGDQPRRVMGQFVSANFFSTLGVKPALGRFFLPDEDVGRGGHPVVVLGNSTWRSVFGADPGIVGRTIVLNGKTLDVVGVASPEFRSAMPLIDPAAFVPLMELGQLQPERTVAFDNRGNNFMNVIARLKDGVSVTQAAERLEAVNTQLAAVFPDSYDKSGTKVILVSDAGIHPSMRAAQVGLSAVILAVVAILLLVACVNVSNLFLARARERAREMAIRLAVGASRGELVRQLMVESLVFAAIAGAAGIAVAYAGVGLANQISLPIDIGFRPDVRLDPLVLTFALAVTILSALIFGIAPALQATRPSLIPALKGEAPAGDTRSGVRHGLIVAQMALSIILLTSAGLFISNLRTATRLDLGFEPAGAVTAALAPALQGYDRARTEQFYSTLFQRLRATPGVSEVGAIEGLPLGIGNSDTRVEIPGYTPAEGEGMNVHYSSVTPEYLAAMRIRLVTGRDFSASDDSAAARVIIVNQRFVDRFWPGQESLGKTIRRAGRAFTVIGVVPTGKYVSLGEDPRAFMYFAQAQQWASAMQLVVRGKTDEASLLKALRTEVQALDRQMPIIGFYSMTTHLGTSLLPARIAGAALGLFGLIGLLLAGIGMYGVMAQSVAQRTREIGIRMALGSTAGGVVRLVMRQGLRHVLAGCVLGVMGAAAAFGLIRSVLYGTDSFTFATFAAAPVLLLAVASLALLLPARRAARLDALAAIRAD